MFAIVGTGIKWQRPSQMIKDYVLEQAENPDDVAEAIQSSEPAGDDKLYSFEKDGEVIAEFLASDAGIEPGYLDAYGPRGGGWYQTQSWMIDGTSARNLGTAPFSGQSRVQLHALYPVDGGVAAIVTNFNEGAPSVRVPGILAIATPVAFARSEEGTNQGCHSFDGVDWVCQTLHGDPPSMGPEFEVVGFSLENGRWVMVTADDQNGLGVTTSDDGIKWGEIDYIGIDLLDGSSPDLDARRRSHHHCFA